MSSVRHCRHIRRDGVVWNGAKSSHSSPTSGSLFERRWNRFVYIYVWTLPLHNVEISKHSPKNISPIAIWDMLMLGSDRRLLGVLDGVVLVLCVYEINRLIRWIVRMKIVLLIQWMIGYSKNEMVSLNSSFADFQTILPPKQMNSFKFRLRFNNSYRTHKQLPIIITQTSNKH